MKKNWASRIIIFCFLFFVFMTFIAPAVFSEDTSILPNDYAVITDVDYKAVVVDEPGNQGKIVVTERLTFDVHAASKNNLFWELWRDLCEDEVDGLKVDYTVNSVKQILPDGSEIVYARSPKLYWDDSDYLSGNTFLGPEKWYHSKGPYNEDEDRYECVFFYVDGIYREEMVFEIEYEMHNAALRYNDCSDLYISLFSEDSVNDLKSFKAEILFPDKDMPAKENYKVFTYGTNANSFPVSESSEKNPGYHTFYFELDEEDLQFKPYNEYIEFDLVSYGEDKHIFTEYAPNNYYSSDDVLPEIISEQKWYQYSPYVYVIVKMGFLFVTLVLSILILIDAFTCQKRIKKKHCFFTPQMELQDYRDIPSALDPHFAAFLVFSKKKTKKDNSASYSAILLSLARKKYITIREYDIGNVLLMLTNETNLEPLTTCEELYLNLIRRHAGGGVLEMKDFQTRILSDYEYTDSFASNMEHSIVNIGIGNGYFQKADFQQPRKKLNTHGNWYIFLGIVSTLLLNLIFYHTRIDFAFGGFFVLGIVSLFSGIYIKIKARKFVLLTQFGEDEYQKWHGLYHFLSSDTLLSERTHIELPLWEQYLVYATAFGISDKVIQAIGIRCPEANNSEILSNHYYRSGRIRVAGRSFHSAVRTGSMTAHSGGSGGGFGYGGGGRGGGGGGGGH